MEPNFKMIPLNNVVPSPTNPRKSFDEAKTIELSESIKEKGVLQPILVRQKGEKYEIVCGERRFRASRMVQGVFGDRNTIPAIIRDLSDQEVREMQLIENFQREDVHPMEEAVAIKAAVESGKYSINDVAAKVGKSLSYIKQRMKLNELSDKWQKVCFDNRMSITDALKIASLPAKTQSELYKDQMSDREGARFELNNWTFNKYLGKLREASFDLYDETLDKKAGPCTKCPFNSAVSKLFADSDDAAICNNISCFKHKSDIHFDRELKIAKDDATVVLVTENSGSDIAKKLRSEGYQVLNCQWYNGDCKPIEAPEPTMTESEFKDEDGYDDEDYTPEEIKKEYQNYLARQQRDKEAYDKKIATGKFKRAFVVDGSNVGKYIYVEMSAKSSSSNSKATSEKTSAADDIKEEIQSIRERLKRSAQIDQNKIWDNIKGEFSPDKHLDKPGNLSQAEMNGLAEALFDKLDYNQKDKFRKAFKITNGKTRPDVTAEVLVKMSRFFLLASLPPSILYSGYENDQNAQLSLKIAFEYFPAKLEQVISDQNAIAEKRKKNAEKKIAGLEAKRKELMKEERVANPKKPVTKKAAKK